MRAVYTVVYTVAVYMGVCQMADKSAWSAGRVSMVDMLWVPRAEPGYLRSRLVNRGLEAVYRVVSG